MLNLIIVGAACESIIPSGMITNSFDKKIGLEVLRVSPVNTVVSPLMMKFPLCKLAAVARGLAKYELMTTFGFQHENSTDNCFKQFRNQFQMMKQHDFLWTTKIFVNESMDVDPSFIENSTEVFGARVEKVGFKYSMTASQFINRGIEKDMLKRVTRIIDPEDININTSMVILNAASFKVTWEKPFYVQLTKDKMFRNMKGELFKIPMMVTLDDLLFLDDPNLDIKMVTIPLYIEDITFIIPSNKTGLPSFIEKIHNNPNLTKELRSRMKRKVLAVSIPRFKIKTYVDWTGFLRLVGINKIMNTTSSGLQRILKNQTQGENKVYLSKAKQKIFLELDEFGSRRYPYQPTDTRDYERTAHFMDRGEELLLDRPFYFIITFTEDRKDYDLFHGAYYGPNEI